MSISSELLRVFSGPFQCEDSHGLGLYQFEIECPGSSTEVLSKVRTVIITILELNNGDWPSLEQWQTLLPSWFVSIFSPEMSQLEATVWIQQWRSLSTNEQIKMEQEQKWTLSNWIYWFQPYERQWFWWDAHIISEDVLIFTASVLAWPIPWGALNWLFRASGAISVRPKPTE